MAKTDVSKYEDTKTRNVYNEKTNSKALKKQYGLTKEIITEISHEKGEPDWALDIRLKALDTYFKLEDPNWGPDISYLNIDNIATYVKPVNGEVRSWDDVPEDIKNVFDKLGIPEAEKQALAGSGAQYDSEIVYHNLSSDLKEKGI